MEPVAIAEKNAIGVKHEKTCNRCQERENMEPVSSAGKHATDVMRRKAWNPCQLQEKMQSVLGTRNHATGVTSGKTNRQPPSSRGKHATGVNSGKANMQPVSSAGKKTGNRCQEWQNMQPLSSAAKAFTRTHDNQIKIIPLSTHMSIISLSDFKYAKERTEMGKRYRRGSLQWLRKIILNDN